ncbi:MAG: hypothetical protein K0Q57_903 [Gammaproteobacteria bacterium]|jgi:hypothetical protein|nr:hypothetical protein [Gammaproteobacteria bacterium]
MRSLEVLQAMVDLHNKYYTNWPVWLETVIKDGKPRTYVNNLDGLCSQDFWLALVEVLGNKGTATSSWGVDANNVSDEQLKKILAVYEQLLKGRAGIQISIFERVSNLMAKPDPRLIYPKEEADIAPPAAKRQKIEAKASDTRPMQAAMERNKEVRDTRPMQVAMQCHEEERDPAALKPLPL